MNDSPHSKDETPAPLEHADAERATEDQAARVPSQPTEPADIEEDPSANPRDDSLRDVKGG